MFWGFFYCLNLNAFRDYKHYFKKKDSYIKLVTYNIT